MKASRSYGPVRIQKESKAEVFQHNSRFPMLAYVQHFVSQRLLPGLQEWILEGGEEDLRTSEEDFWDALGRLWCRNMHTEISWPIHGRYHCLHCRRVYKVPW